MVNQYLYKIRIKWTIRLKKNVTTERGCMGLMKFQVRNEKRKKNVQEAKKKKRKTARSKNKNKEKCLRVLYHILRNRCLLLFIQNVYTHIYLYLRTYVWYNLNGSTNRIVLINILYAHFIQSSSSSSSSSYFFVFVFHFVILITYYLK